MIDDRHSRLLDALLIAAWLVLPNAAVAAIGVIILRNWGVL